MKASPSGVGAGVGVGVDKMLLTKSLMDGPNNRMTTKTMMINNMRINAYSTRPWPFSLGENDMLFPPFRVNYLRGIIDDLTRLGNVVFPDTFVSRLFGPVLQHTTWKGE